MKKLILYFILSFQFLIINSLAQSPNWLWAKKVGQPAIGHDGGGAITTDANGNIFIAGTFGGIMDFDPGVGVYYISSSTWYDSFILKLDSSGNFLWAKTLSATNNGTYQTIAVDASGNVYTTGVFNDTMDFDPGAGVFNLEPMGSNADIYVWKLDPSGNFVWAKAMGGYSHDTGNSLDLDAMNNIYITGTFWGTADFDPGAGTYNLTSAGLDDIFITKLDSAGNFIWAKAFAGWGNDYGYAIAVNPTLSSELYLTGSFRGTTDFDPGSGVFSLASVGNNNDIFVCKLDTAGNLIWAKSMGSSLSADEGYSLAVDPAGSGDVYIKGTFQDGVDFDPGSGVFYLINSGTLNGFICKLNSQGDFSWAIALGGLAFRGNSITIDNTGKVYASGCFFSTVDFNPGSGIYYLTSEGGGDIYISCYDTAGNFLWVKTAGGQSNDNSLAVTLDTFGKIYLTGIFQSDSLEFTPFTLTNASGAGVSGDAFIVKLDSAVVTGINEHEMLINNPSVFPNPFTDEVKINLNLQQSDVTNLTISNTLGQKILTREFSLPENQINLNLQFLPKGIYFFELNSSKQCGVTKIIKQ